MSDPVVESGVGEEVPNEDPLLRSVRLLSARVEVLGNAMYSRADAKKARRRTIIGVLVVVLIAQVISLTTFIGVASTCFIRTSAPESGTTLRTVCNLIPGYDSSERQGQKNLDKFNQLLAEIPNNGKDNTRQDQEIARLQAKVARLEGAHR